MHEKEEQLSEQTGLRQRNLPLIGPSLVAVVVVAAAACAPPPLTDARDAGPPSPDGGETGPTMVEFGEIADLIRSECARAGCHAEMGNANFAVEGGMMASDEQVAAALRDKTLPNEDTFLVEAGKPLNSAIYQAVAGRNGRLRMPLDMELPDEEIRLIERWIDQGASYE